MAAYLRVRQDLLEYPDKAEEINSGSLPAVDRNGIVCIESTAHGQESAFYDMALRAQELAKKNEKDEHGKPIIAKSDYRFHFAPWWEAEEYEADPSSVTMNKTDGPFFFRIEVEISREINPSKRAWYVGKRDADFSGDREPMMQEYPATPEEACAQSVERVCLTEQLSLARREGRITTVPHDPSRPVNNRVVAAVVQSPKTLQALGYVWGKHYLPHDADRRFPGAQTNPTIRDMLNS